MSKEKSLYEKVKAIPHTEKVLEKLPELKRLFVDVDMEKTKIREQNFDKVARYVVLLYSIDSTIIKKFHKHSDCEKHAASLAQLPDSIFKDELSMEAINRMVTNYFLIINEEDFEFWLSLRISYSNLNERLRSRDMKSGWKDEKDKLDCIEKAYDTRKKLKEMDATLFGDHEALQKVVMENSTTRIKEGFAESHAQSYN